MQATSLAWYCIAEIQYRYTAGVQSQPNQWASWPHEILNPHSNMFNEVKDKMKVAEHKPSFTNREGKDCTRGSMTSFGVICDVLISGSPCLCN
jgi:hypothetical protein